MLSFNTKDLGLGNKVWWLNYNISYGLIVVFDLAHWGDAVQAESLDCIVGLLQGWRALAHGASMLHLWIADSRRPMTTYLILFVICTMTDGHWKGLCEAEQKCPHLVQMWTYLLWNKSVICVKLRKMSSSLCLSSFSPSFVRACFCVSRFPELVDLMDIHPSFTGKQIGVGFLTVSVHASFHIQMFPPCPHAILQWPEHNPHKPNTPWEQASCVTEWQPTHDQLFTLRETNEERHVFMFTVRKPIMYEVWLEFKPNEQCKSISNP